MTFNRPNQPSVRCYRLTVARAHLGRSRTEYATVYVRTTLEPADLMFNRGKPIAGIKRVVELALLPDSEYEKAVEQGENCFTAVIRETSLLVWTPDSILRKFRRARRYEMSLRRDKSES